jgi:hypothetical protein
VAPRHRVRQDLKTIAVQCCDDVKVLQLQNAMKGRAVKDRSLKCPASSSCRSRLSLALAVDRERLAIHYIGQKLNVMAVHPWELPGTPGFDAASALRKVDVRRFSGMGRRSPWNRLHAQFLGIPGSISAAEGVLNRLARKRGGSHDNLSHSAADRPRNASNDIHIYGCPRLVQMNRFLARFRSTSPRVRCRG